MARRELSGYFSIKYITLLFIFIFAAVGVSAGQATPLFIIRRSKNANVVHFDANINSEGKIDAKQAVTAYWILLAKQGQREPLKTFDKLAYGYKCGYDKSIGAYRLVIRVFKEREITVREGPGGATAEININGRPARLDEIYINETEKIPFPLVHYIELSGKDKITGGKTLEKIIIHRLPKMLQN